MLHTFSGIYALLIFILRVTDILGSMAEKERNKASTDFIPQMPARVVAGLPKARDKNFIQVSHMSESQVHNS